jgi:transcriptional regulator with XRE-family HTH domain
MTESEHDAPLLDAQPKTAGRPKMEVWQKPDLSQFAEKIIYGEHAKEIGERIKEVRTVKVGGSQNSFAESLGVSRGLVSHWEVGRGINRHHLVQIGAVFNISLYWLLAGQGRPEMCKHQKTLEQKVANRRMTKGDEDKFWTELLAFAEFRLANFPVSNGPEHPAHHDDPGTKPGRGS